MSSEDGDSGCSWKGGGEDRDGESSAAAAAAGEKELAARCDKLQEQVFIELMHEVKHGPPGARLSARLRAALERMSPSERRGVVSRTMDGCAPLFVAARRGNVEQLEYLVHVCCADLEQRGLFAVSDGPGGVGGGGAHCATALWAAAVAGRVAAVAALAEAGADVDARSDSGSSALRSACFMTHLDVVRELAQRGADLQRPNHHGGTALINSVQSPRLCRFLLERGARVEARDAQGKTALHYAVQEHRADTVRLLLAAGADPRVVSRHGDDALRTAALRGALAILEAVREAGRYSARRYADALELLGATQLDELNDVAGALATWRRATQLRHAEPGAYLAKRPAVPPVAALQAAREWRTLPELEAMAQDVDALRTQALLVAVRVLGCHHKDTLFRLMYRGAGYADSFRYVRCAELWVWALQLRVERDTLVGGEAAHAACALTRLLLAAGPAAAAHALPALRAVARAAPAAGALLALRPRCALQADAWDRVLRCVTHLALLAARADREAAVAALRPLLRLEPPLRTTTTGDTLLHLACSRLNVVRSTYFADELAAPPLFPSVEVVRLLLESGADVTQRNDALSTALHVAAVPYNFSTELVETLVGGGAHLDQPNKYGDSAAALVPLCRGSRVRPLRHTTLGCLAARALLASPAAPQLLRLALPPTLRAFLDLHTA